MAQNLNQQLVELHKQLRKNYDNLLQKNQDDLIKITQKEKNYKTRIEELEADSRRLMDQNIMLTAQKTALTIDIQTQKDKSERLESAMLNMKEQISQMKKSQKTHANAYTNTDKAKNSEQQFEKRINNLEKQKQDLIQKNAFKLKELQDKSKLIESQLFQKLKNSNQQLTKVTERQKKLTSHLRKKQQQINSFQEEVQKLRGSTKIKKNKTEMKDNNQCEKCKELLSENTMLRDMIKSTKTMVRVREIEVEKFKIKNEESEKNKKQKSDRFPPINKK